MRPSLVQQQRLERDALQVEAHGSRSVQHVQVSYRLTGRVDLDRLRSAVRAVHQRHEVLRSRFPSPSQVVVDAPAPEVALDRSGSPQETTRLLSELADRPFDLEQGPCWRVVVLAETPGEAVLTVVLDHLLADGASIAVLEADLGQAYRDADLPAPTGAEYYAWAEQQRARVPGLLTEAVAHFGGHWSGPAPVPELWLPSDRTEPDHVGPRALARTREWGMPPAVLDAVRATAREHGTTPNRVVLAAYVAALQDVARSPVTGLFMPVANRTLETQSTVGWFANLVLLPTTAPEWFERPPLQASVDSAVDRAVSFAELPVSVLVDALEPGRRLDGRRHPFAYFDFAPLHRWRGGSWPEVTAIEELADSAPAAAVPGLAAWLTSRGRDGWTFTLQCEQDLVDDSDLEAVVEATFRGCRAAGSA